MGAGVDPLIVTLRDNLATEIETIDKDAEGYHFNYGKVVKGTHAWFGSEEDASRPIPYLSWGGPTDGPDTDGDVREQAAGRTRRYELFLVSFLVIDPANDHDARAWRIESDMTDRLMDSTRRMLGNADGRPMLQYLTPLWFPAIQFGGDEGDGGVLSCRMRLRWDHLSTDMSTGG